MKRNNIIHALIISAIILCILPLMSNTSCTHNNGDLGELFGQWRLESLVVDDKPVELTNDERVYLKFQSSVVEVDIVYPNHARYNCFGTFINDSNRILTLIFDDSTPPEKYYFKKNATVYKIEHISTSELEISAGNVIYTFSKF